MQTILAQICALQPLYSSSNTPEMQQRGRLVRSDLVSALRDRLQAMQSAFDPVFDDLEVEASDGIGRKTEAPWARVFSKAMSPNPRTGFYLVIHFAADGSAVFFTIGCGSTIWSGGDLRPVSDEELARRTSWARAVVEQRWALLRPSPLKSIWERRQRFRRLLKSPRHWRCGFPLASLRVPMFKLSCTR